MSPVCEIHQVNDYLQGMSRKKEESTRNIPSCCNRSKRKTPTGHRPGSKKTEPTNVTEKSHLLQDLVVMCGVDKLVTRATCQGHDGRCHLCGTDRHTDIQASDAFVTSPSLELPEGQYRTS